MTPFLRTALLVLVVFSLIILPAMECLAKADQEAHTPVAFQASYGLQKNL